MIDDEGFHTDSCHWHAVLRVVKSLLADSVRLTVFEVMVLDSNVGDHIQAQAEVCATAYEIEVCN